LGTSEASLEQLRTRIYDYCEWMGQRAFIHPHWQESREYFLNQNWNSYLNFTLEAIGNPFVVERDDLERVLLTYQHHSYLNSLRRVFSGLISQEFAESEKVVWAGMLEDPGESAAKSMGVTGRRASTHYLLLTERSLLIKSSNKPLTQKFPLYGLELEPNFNQGIRITEPLMHPDRDDLKAEAFSCQGTVNGQDVMGPVYDSASNFLGHQYTDVFMKMISAFAVAAQLFEIKEEITGEQSPA